MPIAESNYPFSELAFQKLKQLKKEWQRRISTYFLWLPPLPSPGTTPVIEWGAGEQPEFSAVEFKETAKHVMTKRELSPAIYFKLLLWHMWTDGTAEVGELPGHLGPNLKLKALRTHAKRHSVELLAPRAKQGTARHILTIHLKYAPWVKAEFSKRFTCYVSQPSWVWKPTGAEAMGARLAFTSSYALKKQTSTCNIRESSIYFFLYVHLLKYIG